VPRTANGQVDLAAPAPRTPDGKPDLSGVWNYAGILGFRGRPPDPPPGTPPEATFWNIELGFKEGLPFQPWAAELRKQRMAGESKDNPDAACLPLGHMQLHTHSQPRKIVQTKDLIVILYEANANTRQIFLDGRPAPDNDPQPWWYGYSRGWWEGETLVVETTHLVEQVDQQYPHSADAKIVERYRLTTDAKGTKVLVAEMTMTDPAFYTQPVKVEKKWAQVPNGHLLPYECAEEGWHKRLEELQQKAKPGA
jgi:hypothetical protein